MHNYSRNQANIKKGEAEKNKPQTKSLVEMSRPSLPKPVKSSEKIQAPSTLTRFSEWWNEMFHPKKSVKESIITLPQKPRIQKEEKLLKRFSKWRKKIAKKIRLWSHRRRIAKIVTPPKTFLEKLDELVSGFSKWWERWDNIHRRIDSWFEKRRAAKRSKMPPVQENLPGKEKIETERDKMRKASDALLIDDNEKLAEPPHGIVKESKEVATPSQGIVEGSKKESQAIVETSKNAAELSQGIAEASNKAAESSQGVAEDSKETAEASKVIAADNEKQSEKNMTSDERDKADAEYRKKMKETYQQIAEFYINAKKTLAEIQSMLEKRVSDQPFIVYNSQTSPLLFNAAPMQEKADVECDPVRSKPGMV